MAAAKLYGYRITWKRSAPEAVTMALADLKRLEADGFVQSVARRVGKREITFRSRLDLLTGGTNVVEIVVDPLGGELRAVGRRKPPSVQAAAKYVRDEEHGGSLPGKDVTYYTHEGVYDSLAQARSNAAVARASGHVLYWQRDGKSIRVMSKVPATQIPGFRRYTDYGG